MKKCDKCGRPYIKNSGKSIISGYEINKNLCADCNAVNSVIERMKNGVEIGLEDLKMLPKYLIFDPKSDNPEEEAFGLRFQKIVDRYSKEAVDSG